MKIGRIEHNGTNWEIAVNAGGEVMLRRDTDADEFGLLYWKPVLQPEFVDKVEAMAATLERLGEDEQMDAACIAEKRPHANP